MTQHRTGLLSGSRLAQVRSGYASRPSRLLSVRLGFFLLLSFSSRFPLRPFRSRFLHFRFVFRVAACSLRDGGASHTAPHFRGHPKTMRAPIYSWKTENISSRRSEVRFTRDLHPREKIELVQAALPARIGIRGHGSLKTEKKRKMESNVALRGLLLFFSFLCLSCVISSVGAIPIPPRYDGFSNWPRPKHEPVLLEGFIDPLCIDCKIAWPTVTKVLSAYGPALSFIVHPFPVPFHHNAFFSARALHIASSLNSSSVFPLLERIFEKQATFLNDATNDESPASVVSRFVDVAAEIGLPADKFAAGYADSDTDQATRISFKYGCARHVTSTPTFLVNGIYVTADETWTFEDWTELLEPLISSVSVETSEKSLSQF